MSDHNHQHGPDCNHDEEGGENVPDEIQKLRKEYEERADKMLSLGCWAVAWLQNIRYIGRVSKLYLPNAPMVDLPKKPDILAVGPCMIEMFPVWDYIVMLQPSQEHPGVLSKIPQVLPVDMTGNITPVYLNGANFLFFEDAQEEDRKTYKGLVMNGIIMTEKATTVATRADQRDTGPRIISVQEAAAQADAARRAGMVPPGMRRGR